MFGKYRRIVRPGLNMKIPFVDQVWQIYVLIFLLQSASAAFTPTFQATIPDVLPDEALTRAAVILSLLGHAYWRCDPSRTRDLPPVGTAR